MPGDSGDDDDLISADNSLMIQRKQYFLLALPVLLLPSTGLAFTASANWLGKESGYLLGTGPARWPAISHSLNGIIALSGPLAPASWR